MLVLSAPLSIRHCQAKVGSAVINRNSWLKGRQPLNPDAPADAANVERALHSRRNSAPRPAGGERASSRGDAPAPSCPSPSLAFRGISGGGWGNKKGIDGRRAGRRCCGGGSAAPSPRSAPELGRQRSRAAAPSCNCSCSSSSGAEHKKRLRLQCCLTHFPLPHPLLASGCRASSTFQGNVKPLSKHYSASQTRTHGARKGIWGCSLVSSLQCLLKTRFNPFLGRAEESARAKGIQVLCWDLGQTRLWGQCWDPAGHREFGPPGQDAAWLPWPCTVGKERALA